MVAMLSLESLLKLEHTPVAIKFCETTPSGVERIEEAAVSGCSYWKLASQGRVFYTEGQDHFGCPVGAFTHGIELPEQQGEELQTLVGTMVELEYISADEVPDIPQRKDRFQYAAYGPLSSVTFQPDAVIVTGNSKQMMLLSEAAHAEGVEMGSSGVGRPTCAAIPAVIQSGGGVINFGCIGNRVYTNRQDEELYVLFSGEHLAGITERLATIIQANDSLEAFHRARIN